MTVGKFDVGGGQVEVFVLGNGDVVISESDEGVDVDLLAQKVIVVDGQIGRVVGVIDVLAVISVGGDDAVEVS